MPADLEARLEAVEHVVSVLVAQAAAIFAQEGRSGVSVTADVAEKMIIWSAGFPSTSPDDFTAAVVALMKKSVTVAQAIENVRSL